MADGFSVDLPALESASAGINMTLEELSVARIDSLDGDRGAYGDDDLAGAVVDFCDAAARDRLHGIVQRSSGPDPAAN